MGRDQIEANNARFALALERGDAAAAAPAYTDDAQLLAPNAAPIRGREQVEAFWKGGIQMGTGSFTRNPGGGEAGRCCLRGQPVRLTHPAGRQRIDHRCRQVRRDPPPPTRAWKWAVDIFKLRCPIHLAAPSACSEAPTVGCRRAPTWRAAGHTADTVLRVRAGLQEQPRLSHWGRPPGSRFEP